MKQTTFKILSIITFAANGIWIGYILWAETIGDSPWKISHNDDASFLKFLATLIPSFLLSIFTLFVKSSSYTGEKTAISEENKVLEEKIKREELKQKLTNLKKNNDEI